MPAGLGVAARYDDESVTHASLIPKVSCNISRISVPNFSRFCYTIWLKLWVKLI